ncbi:SUMF1/EgtB/PvdO family nonheme iron enzyme [Magnetococcales bacterium HHB-1]
MSTSRSAQTLPEGYTLQSFRVLKVIGKGGFGITYLAEDIHLDQKVAIKEYLPSGFASRVPNGQQIRPNTPNDESVFNWGLNSFLKEAKTLARFRHPSIVRVLAFIRDINNTAYIVMEYEEGEGLDAILRRRTLSENEIRGLLPPLLDGLEKLHAAHIIHRDIKPANIMIRKEDRSPVILDFGSARQSLASQRRMTSLLTVGYSPFEQYDVSGGSQGAWSDIYSLGAVLYHAITGRKPLDAAERAFSHLRQEDDPMPSTYELGQGRFSASFLRAIDKSLSVAEADRPQSVAAWRPMLLTSPGKPKTTPKPALQREPTEKKAPQPQVQKIAPPPPQPQQQSLNAPKKAVTPRGRRGNTPSPMWRNLVAFLKEKKRKEQHLTTQQKKHPSSRKKDPARGFPPSHRPKKQRYGKTAAKKDQPAAPQTIPSQRKPGEKWVEPMSQMTYLWIPPGKFMMGSPKKEPGRRADEGPQHEVELDGFWMSQFPITWSVWTKVMGSHPKGIPYDPQLDHHPVQQVLWEDTQKFLRKMLRLLGRHACYRLPTEAEWEYAARAGSTTTFYYGNDHKQLHRYAWFKENAENRTHSVGKKLPNAWGLHDMLGNVWEWTEDWYGAKYYQRSPKKNPTGTPVGEIRVRRGGSWRSQSPFCRVAHRNRVLEQANSNALGFRLIRKDKK